MPRPLQQIRTVPITIMEVMTWPTFEQGVADVRAGRGYPSNYEKWEHTNDRWSYERGRQWARLVPRHIKLKVDGKTTLNAVRLFRRHMNDIL